MREHASEVVLLRVVRAEGSLDGGSGGVGQPAESREAREGGEDEADEDDHAEDAEEARERAVHVDGGGVRDGEYQLSILVHK